MVSFMDSLRGAGIDVPRTFGRDEQGRLVLEFVPGTLALDQAPLRLDQIGRVGALVRRIHDVSASIETDGWLDGLLPAPHPNLVCHNDLATWNLLLSGDRLVFIDWDGAGLSSRSWDMAYSAISFAHLFPSSAEAEGVARLAAFADGYDADEQLRGDLPGLMADRARAMYELLRTSHQVGREPWASMFLDFHGRHWLETVEFIERHQEMWRRALAE